MPVNEGSDDQTVRFFAGGKTRTARLQRLLAQAGHQVDPGEVTARVMGPSTAEALRSLTGQTTLSAAAVERVKAKALQARLSTKRQASMALRALRRALEIAKVPVQLDQSEVDAGRFGPSARAAIIAFQRKYRLPETGEFDPATWERMESVNASRPRPVKALVAKPEALLQVIRKPLRLNMTGPEVGKAQLALARLGLTVALAEHGQHRFGGTTRKAVLEYQRRKGLPATGHLDKRTMRVLNLEITGGAPIEYPYRLRGTVRDERWIGIGGVTVQVHERPVRGQGALLVQRKTLANGFFDIPYNPVSTPVHLQVSFLHNGRTLGGRVMFNPTRVAWANLTLGDQPYRGTSDFQAKSAAVSAVLGTVSVADLVENEQVQEVTRVALASGLTQDAVMRLLLAHRVAATLGPPFSPAACYGFIQQNVPPTLPDDLLAATNEWADFDTLVEQTATGLGFLDPDLAAAGFHAATAANLFPIGVTLERDTILAALAARRIEFALDKPILAGSGTLRGVLRASTVSPTHHESIAGAFLRHQGSGPEFWSEMDSRATELGGAQAVADLRATVDLAQIAANDGPTVRHLKQMIGGSGTQVRNLAKLSADQWQELANAAGGGVSGTDMALRAERLFPDVALVAQVGRTGGHGLSRLPQVAQFLDQRPDFVLRETNVDSFVRDNAPGTDPAVVTELRVLQRVHRLAPTAVAGSLLLAAGVHSSIQLLGLGEDGLADKLSMLDPRVRSGMLALAQLQYAKVLERIAGYRLGSRLGNPMALGENNFTLLELQEVLGEVPNLEALFGPVDYCDCEGCMSVYSPAAYLADLMRFLSNRPAAEAGVTVLDVLWRRRPDLADIKLNCPNTDTPLPYIDLVCEALENAVATGGSAPAAPQTTRTAAELRAFPEHLNDGAYETLRANDFLTGGFDLWQVEARMLLEHLGVPRHELMTAFGGGNPTEASIAAEYFGLSSHATELVVTPAPTALAQTEIWGLDATRTQLSVAEFLQHTRISYDELLELLRVAWPGPITLDRPDGTCDLDRQLLNGFTVEKFDRLHRFLRLWRHTPWRLRELGLLLETSGGDRDLDADILVTVHRFSLVCHRLRLSFGQALSLYRPISTGAEPGQVSQYDSLFQNPLLTNPVDPAFTPPLPGTEPLAAHHATLAAAYRVTEAELLLLLPRTGALLTLDNLSVPLRHVTLARGLRIPIADLLLLVDLCQSAVPDPFADPQATLEFIGRYEEIVRSGFTVPELDHLLSHRADSPLGLREATITQQVEGLRETLRSTAAAATDGQIAAHVATVFGLADEQSAILLDRLGLRADLSNPDLTAQGADGAFAIAVTAAGFPLIYRAWRLLHKASILLGRMRVDTATLAWILDRAATFGWLHLGSLPVDDPPGAPLFEGWRKLAGWLHLRARYPEPEDVTLAGIADLAQAAAPIGEVRAAVGTLIATDPDELTTLDGGDSAAYTDPDRLGSILGVLALTRRLSVDVVTARSWARRDDDTGAGQRGVTREIAQIVKAKYDNDVWLSRITPIQDALRELKRTALIAHLLERSARHTEPTITFEGNVYANVAHWRDPNDMLRHFLLDVEMSACQLTSRIKQAIGSVQMFVQRCQLNLERPFVVITSGETADVTSLDSWRQWKWMKNYRVWEANRKIFLYPENWIEPELRDDKTPFFKELEDDVLAGDITDAACETAFHRYLRKVHEVSRLTVVGTYHEIDSDTNVLHVVARTPADPPRYFYRTFDLSYGRWTAWEKIELDIVGDHVVPVVYNRRLHLFWLVFAEKTQKVRKQPPAQATDTPTDLPEPPKLLEIQLAWSVRTPDGFSARRTCPQMLVHPWQRPTSAYHLKPRYKSLENHLWLDLYLSTTQEFNNTRFYDPYANRFAYVTKHRYDERLRPWHSSSFVFDGNVVSLKLKPLQGQYRVLVGDAMSQNPVDSDSYAYVHDTFGSTALTRLSGSYEVAPRLALPEGMHLEFGRLTNNRSHAANDTHLRVIAARNSVTLATGAKAPFEVAQSPHHLQYDPYTSISPLVYQDPSRSFFIRPRRRHLLLPGGGPPVPWLNTLGFTWSPFYHPYTALFLRELDRSGLDGLLNRRIQLFPHSYPPGNTFAFDDYRPALFNTADETATTDIVDFSQHGAYSQYNWEIFFHAPMLIGGKLVANQRFDEAMRWYHRIFDPTNTETLSAPRRYWITKPFFEHNSADYRRQRIEELLKNIGGNLDQLREWKNNPFNPHLIARRRPVAFQRATVMKYLDMLIAWGDQLFRRDTLESVNEATLLYVLAAELLGPRPVKVAPLRHAELSYRELVAEGALDPFGNKQVEVIAENFVPSPSTTDDPATPDLSPTPLPHLSMFYFGIPANTKLLSYWDVVADRLFKVRHCMNIEGAARQLPLFEPPLDPALLVKAAAAGIDLSSVLGLGSLPSSQYRFQVLADKAAALCGEVRSIGDRLLAALERRDAEALALLYAGNELSLRQAIKAVREEQVDEALRAKAALEMGLPMLDKRIEYHGNVPRMNAWEIAGSVSHGLGIVSEIVATVLQAVAGGTAFIPYITAGAAGFGGSPMFTVSYGQQPSRSSFNFAAMFAGIAGILHHSGEMLDSQGNYTRQDEANQLGKRLAELERQQVQVQIEVAGIRHGIAALELSNHELSIEQADTAHAYLKDKYTNTQLYDWLLARLSTVYFQAYQLAFDLARRAEQAFRLELADPSASFIQFGYWDSLRKGLLAADRLGNDLRRMEVAYLDRHTREYEITKHVSLAEVAPLSLLALKLTGGANVALPEWLFDLDYPGHYRRRLKSVGLSIPCVVGPYTSVNCTLSMTNNGVRLNDSVAGGFGDPLAGSDERFARNPVPTAAIATSHAANDRGTFELRFIDERYLPFEFAGAVSEWRIDLPRQNNRFDLSTISDVVIHLDYTAVPGSIALVNAAKANLDATLPTSGVQLFVLDEQFATAWHRMLHPDAGQDQTLAFTLTPEHLPFWAKARIAGGGHATISGLDLILDADGAFEGQIALPGNDFTDVPGPIDPSFGSMPHLASTPPPNAGVLGQWLFKLRKASAAGFTDLTAADVRRAYLVVRFAIS